MPILEKLPKQQWLALFDMGMLYKLSIVWDTLPKHLVDERLHNFFGDILKTIGTTKYIMVLEGGHNFRHAINPNYKANRPDPPKLLAYMQEWAESMGGIKYPSLEADDMLRILHTHYEKQFAKGSKLRSIVISEDKDLTVCGGYRYIPSNGGRKDAFTYISKEDALMYGALQWIMGDGADNVKGMKGIGEGRAPIILQEYEQYKQGKLTAKRKINDVFDYIFYKYQEMYGCDLKSALYAINENYNMIRLLPSHVKVHPENIPISTWKTI